MSVTLRAPENNVRLDSAAAFNAIYELAAYDLSLNYNEPPPPVLLTTSEQKWFKQQLKKRAS